VRWRTASVAGLAALLGGVFAACQAPQPAQFPHQQHLQGLRCGEAGQPACPTCFTCHADSRGAGRPRHPEPSACAACHHDARDVLAEFAGAKPPEAMRGAGIEFSHRPHLARPRLRGACVTCHAGVVHGGPGSLRFPSMAVCLSCHQRDFDEARCTRCHDRAALRGLAPVTFLRHAGDWSRRHGTPARSNQRLCNACHTASQCTDCHDLGQSASIEVRRPDAVDSQQVHRGDFLTMHPLEARSRSGACLGCHTTASCDACHVERGVSAARVGSTTPHPVGWVGRDASSPDSHGRTARRSIATCAACHDQGSATNCVRCHRVGGPGGSPHPGGWEPARSNDSSPCRYCHGA